MLEGESRQAKAWRSSRQIFLRDNIQTVIVLYIVGFWPRLTGPSLNAVVRTIHRYACAPLCQSNLLRDMARGFVSSLDQCVMSFGLCNF